MEGPAHRVRSEVRADVARLTIDAGVVLGKFTAAALFLAAVIGMEFNAAAGTAALLAAADAHNRHRFRCLDDVHAAARDRVAARRKGRR